MEEGVRRGESRLQARSRLVGSVSAKGRHARTYGTKLPRRASQRISKSCHHRVEIGPRGRDGRRVVGDCGLISEPRMRILRQSHPLVYAMLVELRGGRRPGRLITLRRA